MGTARVRLIGNMFHWQATPGTSREDILALMVTQQDGRVIRVALSR